MLVLSRKPDESINIGDQVKVRVVRVAGGRIWLGIDAPRHVRIVRHEIQSPCTTSEWREHAAGVFRSDL